MPSQVPAVLSRSLLHDGAAHTVSAAYFEHPPIPSQTPDWPQLDSGLRAHTWWGSGAPSVVGAQVPRRPDCAQLTQGPVQAMLQQTPSAQNPEAHCDPALQMAPSGFGPQLPFTHFDPTQSVSEAQVAAQAPVVESQVKGAQMTVGPAVQVPWPSQTRPPLTAGPSQEPRWHIVPRTKLRQAPAPSHVPSRPQVEGSDAGQTLALRGAPPAGTNAQIPWDPALLQDLHVSVQALLQQTPSTQNPLAQSPPHPQAAPLAPLILLVPLQATAGASLPPSRTDPSAPGVVERMPHPVAQRLSQPTATTSPKSRAARKLSIWTKLKRRSPPCKARPRFRPVKAIVGRPWAVGTSGRGAPRNDPGRGRPSSLVAQAEGTFWRGGRRILQRRAPGPPLFAGRALC